ALGCLLFSESMVLTSRMAPLRCVFLAEYYLTRRTFLAALLALPFGLVTTILNLKVSTSVPRTGEPMIKYEEIIRCSTFLIQIINLTDSERRRRRSMNRTPISD